MTSPHVPENTSLNSSEGIGMSNSTEMVERRKPRLDWSAHVAACARTQPDHLFPHLLAVLSRAALSPEDEGRERK